jgi:hypothetical protein
MRLLPLCLLLLGTHSTSCATTIQFDELGTASPINVNGVHIQGVLFGFSPDVAFFNDVVGTAGNAVLSVDPVLSGPTSGTLTLTFDLPTPLLRFDILPESIFPIDDSNQGLYGGPAHTVLLSNGLNLAEGTMPQPNGVYSEGEFVYSGQPINSAVISFFRGTDAGDMQVVAFGLDNLTFNAGGTGLVLRIGFWPAGGGFDEAAATRSQTHELTPRSSSPARFCGRQLGVLL